MQMKEEYKIVYFCNTTPQVNVCWMPKINYICTVVVEQSIMTYILLNRSV